MDKKNNKIWVNESLMDKGFFKENVIEAKRYVWHKENISELKKDHVHCIVCMKPISKFYDKEFYKSSNGYLCMFCMANYVSNEKKSTAPSS